MKVIADINILLRIIVRDDETQARAATAETVAIALPSLCEVVWVLRSGYGYARPDVLAVLDTLLSAANVIVDRPAVDAGLATLRAGGDFGDGIIAHEGKLARRRSLRLVRQEAAVILTKQGAARAAQALGTTTPHCRRGDARRVVSYPAAYWFANCSAYLPITGSTTFVPP